MQTRTPTVAVRSVGKCVNTCISLYLWVSLFQYQSDFAFIYTHALLCVCVCVCVCACVFDQGEQS